MATTIGRPSGDLRTGTITYYDASTYTVRVAVGSPGFSSGGDKKEYTMQLPAAHIGDNGAFMGAAPVVGASVVVALGESNQWYIVSYMPRDPATRSTFGKEIPKLNDGDITIQSNSNTSIKLNTNTISIGEYNNSLTLDTGRDIASNTFNNIYSFTEGSREITGIILRDRVPQKNISALSKETSLDYNDSLKKIGMDPIVDPNPTNNGTKSIRNPARIEKREVIFEYAKSFNIESNDNEFKSYVDNTTPIHSESKVIKGTLIDNRRDARADVLSLSLVSPNFLMETIKGTVVDIYGNILDINRFKLPFGSEDKLSILNAKTSTKEKDKFGSVFKNIKTLERRSLAYHFEINSRKDTTAAPDVKDQSNYARQRSRFFLDIDKEGQFKLNVPASSETGNIPLQTRYENYSTINPNDDSKDPNDVVLNSDKQDIMIESILSDTNAVISIKDDLNGAGTPIDRFSQETKKYIKHGTVYHNIMNTCFSFQGKDASGNDYTDWIEENNPTTGLFLGRVPNISNIVNPVIKTSGDTANGGGRSGSLNFDGSIELNVGANTVDRHSIWLDTQGSIIGNVGRDLTNNISAALAFDGEVLIQSGGPTSNDDSRFTKVKGLNNGSKPGVVDIRVINASGSKVTVLRIDKEGVSITTQDRMVFYSEGDMMFRSMGKIHIDGEGVYINDRNVQKDGDTI